MINTVYDESVRKLRKLTGFFLIFILTIVFSFSFIGVTNEFSDIQTLDHTLENLKIEDFFIHSNSYIYDKNGEIISEVYSSENRTYLPFDQIPTPFIEALIATEDRQFFSHKGFDMTGIVRAFFVNKETEQIKQGGSTITQQLVKNLFLTNERTYNRKLSELLYAYQFERLFSKEEILEIYVNTIFFQNGVYGIEAASQFYFSRPSNELSVAEVAFLSAIPNNPTYYNPLIHPENTNERKDWVLTKMLEMDFIASHEHKLASAEKIQLNVTRKIDIFPEYVTLVHHEFKQMVSEEEGFYKRMAEAPSIEKKNKYALQLNERVDELLSSGIRIHTSLDQEKQKQIDPTIEKHLPDPTIQATAVMIDDERRIVAISGGKDYRKFNFHRGFQAFRQPGSAIKSLLVFPAYLAENKVPISSNISAAPFCKNGYCPQNFGGAIYGNTTIETAFKHSYNTAATRMMDDIGIERAFSYFEQLGFSNIVFEDYRLPAALGGLTYGVSPLEITAAYTTFAHDGMFQRARAIQKVVDRDGNVLYEWNDRKKQVWDRETNEKMRMLLNKVVTEGTGRRAAFNGSSYIGGKTGTTNDFHDLWFIGLNEKYTTGVWIGHDQPKSLQAESSQSPHLLIWRDLMKEF